MTMDSSQLKFLKPSPQSVISIANGSTSLIIGEGSVILFDTFTLDIVLIVPSLDYNLLLVSQIISTLANTVWCFPKHFNLMILERFYRALMVDRTGAAPQTFEYINFNSFKIEFKRHSMDLSQ